MATWHIVWFDCSNIFLKERLLTGCLQGTKARPAREQVRMRTKLATTMARIAGIDEEHVVTTPATELDTHATGSRDASQHSRVTSMTSTRLGNVAPSSTSRQQKKSRHTLDELTRSTLQTLYRPFKNSSWTIQLPQPTLPTTPRWQSLKPGNWIYENTGRNVTHTTISERASIA